MTRYNSTIALVIKSTVFGESDLRVTLLTPLMGKIAAIAKGAKSIKSSRLSSLQIGNIVKVQLFDHHDILWLSESATIKSFMLAPKNLIQHNLLFFFFEVLNQLIADSQQIDNIYTISTQIVDAIQANQFNKIIQHEIEFISLLGFGVPASIIETYRQKQYSECQKQIKDYFESILDHPLRSPKLFQ